jgi:hypothetical protein
MNVTLAKRIALLPVAVLLMGAVPLVDPPPLRAPPELTSKEIFETMRGTLVKRGWMLGKEEGQAQDATLYVRSHSLTVRFSLKDREVHMNYLDSVNFDYKHRRDGKVFIHRKYDQWMRNFTIALAQDLHSVAVTRRN